MATKKVTKKAEATKTAVEETVEAAEVAVEETVETAEEEVAEEQEKTFAVEVVRMFKDKYTGKIHHLKETMEVTESRYKELTEKKKYVVKV
ncbi:MAG: hypothetical protein LUE24_13965 [Lachnospiraceae bacterium]|nr:hypothetical protein [Lachnospiraceae bacterium]